MVEQIGWMTTLKDTLVLCKRFGHNCRIV